jgi:hypothetical protein
MRREKNAHLGHGSAPGRTNEGGEGRKEGRNKVEGGREGGKASGKRTLGGGMTRTNFLSGGVASALLMSAE